MERYLIMSSHTEEECLKALDEILAQGTNVLNRYDWGCASGDHTGYAIVEAERESDVRNMIPGFLRGKARIMKVSKFTPEQIRHFHKAA